MGSSANPQGKTGAVPVRGALGLLMLAGVLTPGAAHAADRTCPPPNEIVVNDFSREFIQSRHLKGVSAPLVSEGTVSLAGERILWHNRSPFDILTTFGPDGITQSVEGSDPEPVSTGGGAVPGLGGLPLASVLRGDLNKLGAYFRISTSVEAGNGPWVAVLSPLDRWLADILGTVEMRGCAEVERVILRRPAGDYDVIELLPPK